MPTYGLMENQKDYGSETQCAYNDCKQMPEWVRLADLIGPGRVYICYMHTTTERSMSNLLSDSDYTQINVDVVESPAVIAHLLKAVARG